MAYLQHVNNHIPLILQRAQLQRGPAHPTPLPDCEFIQSAAMNLTKVPRTTATRQSSQAKKLEEIKHANNIAIATKRQAALAARIEAAEKKATEAQEKKARATEKKAALAQARKIQVANKRAADLEAKKIAVGAKKESVAAKKKRSRSYQEVS